MGGQRRTDVVTAGVDQAQDQGLAPQAGKIDADAAGIRQGVVSQFFSYGGLAVFQCRLPVQATGHVLHHGQGSGAPQAEGGQ